MRLAVPEPGPAPEAAARRRQHLWALVLSLPFLYVTASNIASFQRLHIVLLAVLPVLVLVFMKVELGVYFLIVYGAGVMYIKRMMPGVADNQLGAVMEVLLALMGMRLTLDLIVNRDLAKFKTPLTWPLLAYIAYLVLEIFNPLAPSIAFGLYGSRDTLRLLGFFLPLAYFRDSRTIKRFVWVFIVVAFLEGWYGIWQHHHGLSYQEWNWMMSSGSWHTHLLKGYIRVFATLGDAATFGFLEILGAIMLYALALTSRGWKQVGMLLMTIPMLYAMVLSYSRGPMVALVFGIGAILVVSRNWRLAISVVLIGTVGLLVLGTVSHRLTDRIATARDPATDPSFLVRMEYIHKYAPDILLHPFGGGLYTAGASGLLLTDGQHLDGTTIGIPTDNNYFKIGLEQGVVGLSAFILLQLMWMWHTFKSYRRLRDPFLKATALGLLGIFVTMFVGAFSNDIFVQKPLCEFIWVAVGLAMLLGQHRSVVCASR